jgi:hypothetical protein
MNVRLVNLDPSKSSAARIIYEYGQEQYYDGLLSGAIYASLVFIFLLCAREYMRAKN